MDDNGASVDDQGSGWFQVKKKHRSSSKFSIQNWVGGFSRQQVNVKGQGQGQGQTSNGKYRSNISRPEKDNIHKGVSSLSSSSKQHEKDERCLDKRVVNDNDGRPKTPPLKIITTTSSQSASIPKENLSEKKPDIVHRIKWGDLEDNTLGQDCGTKSLSEIRFGEIGDDDLAMCGTSRNICDLNVCNLSKENSVVNKDKLEEQNFKEVNEVASTNSKVIDELAISDVKNVNDDISSEKMVDISSSIVNPDVNDSDLSVIKDKDENGTGIVVSQDLELEPPENCNVGPVTDNLSNTPNINGVKEPEEGESKERFRERLWSFLFENLNRAIDELYLLCELECDLGQVKESILVLQEAESDFRELKIRVEEFETMKNSNGAVMSIKGDHRRPHALSWEVRRMTTSPHRAEILSSSLEAFKKIQQEREKERVNGESSKPHSHLPPIDDIEKSNVHDSSELETKSRRKSGISETSRSTTSRERRNIETGRSGKNLVQNSRISLVTTSNSEPNTSKLPPRGSSTSSLSSRTKKELPGSSELDKDKLSDAEISKKINVASDREKEKDKRYSQPWKPVDAWKEKRNWEEILAPPSRFSSRASHSPCMSRRSAERARVLHDKLMSPEKKKKTALDLKKEAEEKHARAMRIRSELENERVQKLQRTSEKLNRVSEWHAVRSMKLREGMYARHQRSESRHEAYIAQVVKRAGDESIKVNEVRFITSLNEENKKFMLHQKLHGSEMRRNEKIQVMKTKQKEDMAREEAVIERRKLIEAEKLQRLVETQRRKEEAQLRREEERKASSAAREARTMEQLRRKEERAKAQQEEAELLAQRLAERLSESEQRRKVYLEQIRERASMDFRDQSSPLMRRSVNKEGQGKSTPPSNSEDNQGNCPLKDGESGSVNNSVKMQQSLKRRIKKIRQRLMALKHEVLEPLGGENVGIGYRTSMATSRAKIGRWIQDLQRLRQERKEGAASIGLISAEMIKFLEGKELELQASRQAGLLDFISSALPASHISKPEACQVTIYLLRLLKVVLSIPTNRNYFLSQNLLPPLIPMLSAALESYIKITASLNGPSINNNSHQSKISSESFDSISEVLEGFLWISTMIIGLPTCDERQCQMQDGLLELIVSYQIIHRLRDLFALYDRPPVEGSPFPESILLSIKLLVVLTSKPCVVSSFDWENEEVYDFTNNRNSGRQLAPNFNMSELSGKEKEEQCDEKHDTKVLNDSLEMYDSKPNISRDEKNSGLNIIGKNNGEHMSVKPPYAFLLSAISETGLVSLLSLLTAVLLQANNRLSSEQGSYVLPSNFEEVATGVLKVLNNLGLTDIAFMQQMLAMPDLKMEFFHIMSFLLSHCTNNWKVASDQVGLLLFESLTLLGYFSLFHPGNQAVLRWGNTPTILHKVCDLPFAFFSDLELMPILAGTLVAVCFGCEQNKAVVQQELSTEMIVSLIKSWKTSLTSVQSKSSPSMEDSTESSLLTLERRKVQTDVPMKSTRSTSRGSRLPLSKGGSLSGNTNGRIGKIRNSRDGKVNKVSEDSSSKIRSLNSESPTTMPFYCRFPPSFIDKAEQFFSQNSNGVDEPACLTSY